VAHYGENGHQYERMEMLDGQMRRVFRHDDEVLTLWPERRLAVIEQREPGAAMPVLLRARPDERVFERYELRPQGSDRVAGHEAQMFLLHPRDGLRFAQRLWMEPHSALLLRVDLLAADGHVLESAAFSELTLSVRPQPETVLRPMRKLDGYRVLRPAQVPTRLDAEGWSAPEVPGFELLSCVKRVLDEGEDGRSGETLQVVYADGLTHVSLFIEPYRGEHQRPMQTAIGATHTLMQRQGPWWVTAVGEVPMGTLQKFAAGLVRRP
jgi:sigma-E factor negative regulatory protein RseB